MANIKSAIKRAKTNEKARLRNKAVKTNLKTTIKNLMLQLQKAIRPKQKKLSAQQLRNWIWPLLNMSSTKMLLPERKAL